MRPKPTNTTPSARRARRGRVLFAAGMSVGALGMMHGALQWWGDLAAFRQALDRAPLVWWSLPSDLIFWAFGACMLWSTVAGFVAENARAGDRRPWWLGYPGLIPLAALSLATSWVASRQGVALFDNGVALRANVLDPLEVVPDAQVAALATRCEMVRRPRSLRANDLIDRPTFHLVLADGRRVRLGGVRGAGLGELSQDRRLIALRRLSDHPVLREGASPACVARVVKRFRPADRAFVRTLFVAPTPVVRDHVVCAPGRSVADGGCVRVPVAPGPPAPRPISPSVADPG